MLYGSVSSKNVVAKVIRDLHIQDVERWVDMIEWIGEALEHIGAFDQFVNKTIFDLEVKNKRVALPCDLYSIIQLSRNSVPLKYLGGSFDFSFHCEGSPNLRSTSKLGYTLNGPFINTNFSGGTLHLAYQAFATDEEGWPTVPDNVSFLEACYRYIVYKIMYPEWMAGRLSDAKYEKIEQTWHFYCVQARGVANMPTIDQIESMKNNWIKLVPDIRKHDNFFNDIGDPVSSRTNFFLPGNETVTAVGSSGTGNLSGDFPITGS